MPAQCSPALRWPACIWFISSSGRCCSRTVAPKPPKEEADIPLGRLLFLLLTSFFPLAFLILAVLGAIFFGWATPSEAAAVGAVGGLVLAAAYRALTWQRLRELVYLTVRTTAMVCWLFVGSSTFASVFAYLGGEQVITQFVTGLDMSPLEFLLLSQLIIFLLGWPLEWTEIIIIFVPIFLPLLPHFGIDPLFFGILVALNLQTAFLSPPMAMSAYYLKGIAPPFVQLVEIFRGSLPFLLLVLVAHGAGLRVPADRLLPAHPALCALRSAWQRWTPPTSMRSMLAAGWHGAKCGRPNMSKRSCDGSLRRDPDIEAFAFFDPAMPRAAAKAVDEYRASGRPIGALHGLTVGVEGHHRYRRHADRERHADRCRPPSRQGCRHRASPARGGRHRDGQDRDH